MVDGRESTDIEPRGNTFDGPRANGDRSDNLDTILAFIKDRADIQNAQITSLDGKANFGLAAASLLTAGMSSLHSAFFDSGRLSASNPAMLALSGPLDRQIILTLAAYAVSVLAVLTYVVVVFSAYQAYKVRGYIAVPKAKALLNDYWNSRAFDTKASLASTLAESIEENDLSINAKANWVRLVMRSLVVEATELLLITILQVSV